MITGKNESTANFKHEEKRQKGYFKYLGSILKEDMTSE